MPGRFFVGDLRTGEVTIPSLPASGGSTGLAIGSAGQIQCTVPLPLVNPDDGTTTDLVSLITGPKSFLAYEEWVERPDGSVLSSKVLNAGPIWIDAWDDDKREWTLTAAGIRSIFDWRLVLPLLVDATADSLPTSATVNLSGDLRDIARDLVVIATQATGGALPIDLPAITAGSNVRNYVEQELKTVGAMLTNLSGVNGGPDIAFRPYLSTPTMLRWAMVTGNPRLEQAGAAHKFDTSVPVPPIRGTKITRDWRNLASAVYATGEGVNKKAIDNTMVTADFPRMEVGIAVESITAAVVLEHAQGLLNIGQSPISAWSFEARKSSAPTITEYAEGDRAVIAIGDENPRLPRGEYAVRIMSINSAHDNDFVQITCAPSREA